MKIQAVGLSDVGCVRDHNEDAFFIDAELGLHIVCDGMGGHAAGEVASAMTVEAITSYVRERRSILDKSDGSEESLQALADLTYYAMMHASQTVFSVASGDAGKAGMGTTCVGLLTVGNKGVMMNVGDSRLYLVRDGQLHQLSTDHTYVNEAVAGGLMSREEAEQSPHAHVLTRAVGTQASVGADVLAFDLLPGDTYLLCSDGLHEYTADPTQLSQLVGVPDISSVPQTLIDIARNGGGHDNITAIVMRVATSASEGEETRRATIVQEMEALREIDLFNELSLPELVRIYGRFVRMDVEPGATLITEGDTTEHLFVLVEGQCDVNRQGNHVARLGAGTHFGEMALLSARKRSANVIAATRASLLCLDRSQFRDLIAHEPQIANKFLLKFANALSLRLDDAYLAPDFVRGRTTMGLGKFPDTTK